MYLTIDYDKKNNIVYLRDDQVGSRAFYYDRYVYELDPNGEYKTLTGVNCKKVKVDYNEKLDYNKYFEIDIDPVIDICERQYNNLELEIPLHNKVVVDIECDFKGIINSENIKLAEGQITAITLYSFNDDKYYTFILSDKESEYLHENNKYVKEFREERSLLYSFIEFFNNLAPTIATGWNVDSFDFPYIYYRACKVLGRRSVNKMSVFGIIEKDKGYDRRRSVNYDKVNIYGLNILDYMLLHRKFYYKEEESESLDYIANKYLNIGKIKYTGTLEELYKKDREKFIEYNINDVYIVKELDNYFKYLDLSILLTMSCYVPPKYVFYSVKMNEGTCLSYLRRKNIVSLNTPKTCMKNIGKKYLTKGGFVVVPDPGIYEWVCDLDFKSLYPSIMRNLNVGLDTFVCMIKDSKAVSAEFNYRNLQELNSEYVDIVYIDHSRRLIEKKVHKDKLLNSIKKNGFIVASNGCIFRRNDSFCVDILNEFDEKRTYWKNKMKDCLKSNDSYGAFIADIWQKAYKIKMNDAFGVFSTSTFRYTDGYNMLFNAVTSTGRFILKSSMHKMNSLINNEVRNYSWKKYVISGATDSMFLHIKDLIKAKNPDIDLNDKMTVIPIAYSLVNYLKEEFNKFMNELSNFYFNVGNKYFMVKPEFISERAVFLKKNRYAIHIVNKEGVDVDEYEIVGIEFIKSNLSEYYRKWGKDFIVDLLNETDFKKLSERIKDFYFKTLNVSFRDISIPSRVNNIWKYVGRDGKYVKGTPINSKAAINYNYLLKEFGLNEKYNYIQEGSKMYYVQLKRNPYNIDVIGFLDDMPPEIEGFINTYVDKEKNFESCIYKKVTSIFESLNQSPPELKQYSMFEQ